MEKILPVNGDTTIDLGVLKPGRLAYSCGMGMYTGRLTITEAHIMTTYTFAVTGMHCASCGLLIDETLRHEIPGVRRAQTSLRKARTVVEADDSVDAAAIAAAIASAGYQATLEASS